MPKSDPRRDHIIQVADKLARRMGARFVPHPDPPAQPKTAITRKTVVVNVNRQVVDRNTKAKRNDPPIRVQRGKSGKAVYGHEVAVLDAHGEEVARFIYDPAGAVVACGARLVLVAHHGAKVVS